ncbi:MAG: DUF3592 domain-containing protein [Candidatus Obscuribacterales bacterium]|nr:DUF3592 domain-containing protein [Candidatus Obscuribacterales bacterium]
MVKVIGSIFLAVGLSLGSAALIFYLNTQDLLSQGLRSQGTVVDLRRSSRNAYAPVVRFETIDHQTITAASTAASNPPAFKIADSVTVLYRAKTPSEIHLLNDPLDLWLLPGILAFLSLIFASVGGGILVYSFQKRDIALVEG